jgi:hypothetical protein
MLGVDLHRVLTEQHSSLIVFNNYANFYLNEIKTPKCTELFITIIDGYINIYVPQQNIYKNIRFQNVCFSRGTYLFGIPPIFGGIIMQKRCNLVVRRRQTCEFYFENQCFTEF